MDLNQDDRGGKTDKHYQFVFSAEGNPQQYHGMSFCNINCGGDGNSSDGGGSCTSRKRIHEASNRSIETPKKKPSTGQGVAPGFAHASLDEVERLLARSMTTLSMQDRERAMEDLHGVRAHSTVSTASSASAAASNDPAATPVSSATILTTSNSIDELANDQRLTEMEVLLQQNSNEAYRLAMTQSPEYVKDSRFRLSFLNTFQTAIAAAQKMLQFLEIKLQHFGSEALCRDLTMDDLDENAKDCLECGFYQYLGRDSGGRRVVGTFPMLLEFKNIVDVVSICPSLLCSFCCVNFTLILL